MKLKLIYTSLFFTCIYFYGSAQLEEGIVIKNSTQVLEFYLADDNSLNAKLKVNLTVNSEEANKKFILPIFYNSFTSVSEISRKVNNKRAKKYSRTSDYESDGIFHSDLKVSWLETYFEEAGDEVNFNYEKIFKDVKFLDPLYFRKPYKVDASTIKIIKPSWLDLGIEEFNFSNASVTKNEVYKDGNFIYQFAQNDLDPFNRLPNAPGRNKLNAHVILVPKAVEQNGESKEYFKSTQSLYNWYASLVKLIDNDNSQLTSLVKRLTSALISWPCLYNLH
ncbi:MAG: hypothetical protein AAGK97_12355, partial [Bacteroidota bacterium]